MSEMGGQPAGPNMGQLAAMKQHDAAHGAEDPFAVMDAFFGKLSGAKGMFPELGAAVSGLALESMSQSFQAVPGMFPSSLLKGLEFTAEMEHSDLLTKGAQEAMHGHHGPHDDHGAQHHDQHPQHGIHDYGDHGHHSQHGHDYGDHGHHGGDHGHHHGGDHGHHGGDHGHHGGGGDDHDHRGESELGKSVDGGSMPDRIDYNLRSSDGNDKNDGLSQAEQNEKMQQQIDRFRKLRSGSGSDSGDTDTSGGSSGSNRSDNIPPFGQQFGSLPPGMNPQAANPAINQTPSAARAAGHGKSQGQGMGRGA